ncbi:MAG: hypothetical protein AMJ64_02880 [Betaproteobacteria bacterium SG8_39]|nr:MAG: hypothetical protein AMJ64_02880 [Betaproteobacteria bacterium SG8_39]
MGKKHHGHWFGKGHSHHKHHVVNGTRDDDVLKGSENDDTIKGHKGDDQLFGYAGNDKLKGGKGDDELYGGAGNDKLDGGKGNDLLDGGAGSDKVKGGKGDDIAVYSLAENAGTDACGNPVRDFYDGGKGEDVLRLVLTKEELASEAVQEDLDAFRAFLADDDSGCGGHGKIFEFSSFNLTVRNFEALEIVGGNTPPEAQPDAYTTDEDEALVVPVASGVLANDTDADGDDVSAPIGLITNPTNGTLTFNEDGSFTYAPNKDYFGPDKFTYQASDGQDESDVTEVGITVRPVNDRPVANTDSVTVPKNSGPFEIDVLANDTPGPGNESDQTLEVLDFGFPRPTPAGGEWSVGPDNTIWYTPPPDYVGSDSFRYLAADDGEPPIASSGLVQIDIVDVI